MTTKHKLEDWNFCTRDLGGELGPSYAVDLPNGAQIFISGNDDSCKAYMQQVSAVPHLVRACRLLLRAYEGSLHESDPRVR
jgi:hypothetical protein